jgi:hypothetical protein
MESTATDTTSILLILAGADRETGQAPGWPMCVGLEILVYMIFCKFQGKF